MSKKKIKSKKMTRRQITRRQKELKTQQIITWIAIGIGALILIIIGYGIIAEVRAERQPVARVYDDTISSKAFQTRQSYERTMAHMELAQYHQYLQQFQGMPEMAEFLQQVEFARSNLENQLSPNLANIFAGQVLDTMLEEAIVQREAAARGLSVSADEVEARVELLLGYDREALEDNADMPDMPEYAEYYAAFKSNILDASGFSEQDFREIVRAQLLREQLIEVLSGDFQTMTEQIEGTLLIVDSEESGATFARRINEEGEPIEIIVEEINTAGVTGTLGFPISWIPEGYLASNLGPEIERAAWDTEVGTISAPILAGDGQYYMFHVGGRENRPMDAEMLAESQQERYRQWLADEKSEHTEYLDGWQRAVVRTP